MAEITYVLNQETPENIPGFEQYQDSDKYLIPSYQLNNLFDSTKNYVQLHIVDFADNLLSSKYNYRQYTLSLNAASAGKEGASIITIDPIKDSLYYGYNTGGIKLLYHFLSDLYTDTFETLEFYIDSISADRTELSLLTHNLTPEQIVSYTEAIKTKLKSQSYFSEFRLDLKNNNLIIGVNIDTLDTVNGKSVIVKLYEPLPENFKVKNTLNIVESISDSVAYEVDYQAKDVAEPTVVLRSPNFNIDIQDHSVVPSQYFTYDDLLGYQVGNTNSEIYSMINEKGVELSVDYSDFSNFVHFSSAQERLINFKYKVDLLTSYSASLSTTSTVTGGAQGVSGSTAYYQGLYQGIINNFDHYERFLYYESGSYSWPKSNSSKPYINIPSKDPVTQIANTTVTAWYTNALTNAVAYDSSNYNALTETVPTYLRDDANNEKYLTFVYMVGQHFDNLWIYGKAVTDKYNNDNRINYGISKDLVGEALKNFGVKLYTSNKSIEDLFTTFIGQAYQSGSEKINHYVTGSLTGSNTPIQPTSYDDYQKQVQKRIYHNLPLLLKSKGTERGLRALINCLGIPSDILKIKLYGGRNTNERPFFGDYDYYTGSLDKIRLDNTGSIVPGNTLSNYTSIIKRDDKYTDDLHIVEVGFAPVDNVDNYIKSHITGSFDIDDYIGNPDDLTSGSYSALQSLATNLLTGSLGTDSHYNLQDYVKLIKFYDNTIFKMVKDFIPARALADTGIIIKPNLLNRSKAKSVIASGSRPEYSGSIDTAFIVGGNAGIFNGTQNGTATEYSTAYTDTIQTPTGLQYPDTLHGQEQPKINGEFLGSEVVVTGGNLTVNNPYLQNIADTLPYQVSIITTAADICLLTASIVPYIISDITLGTPVYVVNDFFTFTGGCNFTITAPSIGTIPITFPHAFGNDGLGQYENITITATNPNLPGCSDAVRTTYGICYVGIQDHPQAVVPNLVAPYNITNWFNTTNIPTSNLEYTITWSSSTVTLTYTQAQSYTFTQPLGEVLTIQVRDTGLGQTCKTSIQVLTASNTLGVISADTCDGLQFQYKWEVTPGDNPDDPYGYGGVTTYSDATVGAVNSDNYNIPWLPRIVAPNLKGKGIAGFFTPFNDPVGSIGVGSTTRFTIYNLTNLTPNTGGWKIEVFDSSYRDINPYGPPGNLDLVEHNISNYPFGNYVLVPQLEVLSPTITVKPPYTDNQYQYPLAVDLESPYANMGQIVNGQYILLPVGQETFVRAHVIQAYSTFFPETPQQVTVYGQKEMLAPLEGLPRYPATGPTVNNTCPGFIDVWLKEGFQYGSGPGQFGREPSQISIYSKGTSPDSTGKWIKVPIRYYSADQSQTSINQAITAVVGFTYPPGP